MIQIKHLTTLKQKQLRAVANGVFPSGVADEKARLRLKRMGLADREHGSRWKWHLTPEGTHTLDAKGSQA